MNIHTAITLVTATARVILDDLESPSPLLDFPNTPVQHPGASESIFPLTPDLQSVTANSLRCDGVKQPLAK